jgi:hypothetical protein
VRTVAPEHQRLPVRREADGPRAVWWLHPRYVVLLLGIPLLIVAYLLPEGSYLILYRSLKHVDRPFLIDSMVVYAAFIAGTFAFFSTGPRPRPQWKDVLLYCRTFVWPLFVLTVFGYAAWFAYAAALNGLGTITGALLDVVLARDVGTYSYAKDELFVTLPGLTTVTQCAILYVTVEALLWVRRASDRLALARFAMVLSLALVRALLLSERLALVELVIPVVVIFVTIGPISNLAYRNLVRLAPVFIGVGVFGLFAVGEYFRSWTFFQPIYSGPYLKFAAERFLGYYATAVNNGAVVYYYEPIQPLRYTFQNLLEFPILGSAVSAFYTSTLGEDYIDYTHLLETYANPEFNNTALVGLLLNEYSLFLAPVAGFLLGLLSVTLYNSFLNGRLVGILLYPSFFVGVLEISRIYYWSNTRYFPTLAFLLLSLLLFSVMKVPIGDSSSRRDLRKTVGSTER